VLIVFAAVARREIGWWVQAGRDSRAISERLEAAVRAAPAGTLLVVDVPDKYWVWALPFALRPPFVGAEVSSQAHLVWSQAVDCCRGQHWLDRMKAEILAWQQVDTRAAVIVWDDRRRDFVRRADLSRDDIVASLGGDAAFRTPADFEAWLQARGVSPFVLR
jgi:hypothetical protein